MATSRLSLAGILIVALLLGGCDTISPGNMKADCFKRGGYAYAEGSYSIDGNACLFRNPGAN